MLPKIVRVTLTTWPEPLHWSQVFSSWPGSTVVADESSDKDALETAAKELNDKIMPIGAKMYEQAEAPAEDSSDESEDDKTKEAKDEEAIEGEVVDDKEDSSDKSNKKD